jgi:hypothetical protein
MVDSKRLRSFLGSNETYSIEPEDTLSRMVELRREIDPNEQALPHPNEGFEYWYAPEYAIWLVSRTLTVLQRDGMSEEAALRKIDGLLKLAAEPAETDWRLRPYLKRWLELSSPEYLDLGDELLEGAIGIAVERTVTRLGNNSGGWPPAEWFAETITRAEFEEEYLREGEGRFPFLSPRSRFDIEFTHFLLRLQDDDRIVQFSSPSNSWTMKMGSSGIAIVRNGRAIVSITTIMN